MVAQIKPRIKMGSKGGAYGGLPDGQRFEGFYEGASRTYRLGNKGIAGGGADVNIASKLHTLRNRARTIIANNPYGETSVTSYAANVIGRGFTAKFANKELQELWNQWKEECDADGLSNLAGLAELAARAEFSDGEVLTRRRERRKGDGLAVPLQIQLLECDYLDAGYNDLTRNIHNGIQYSALGKRTYFHLFKAHPGEGTRNFMENPLDRVPVPSKDIIHLFRRLRPGQNRGVPKLANIIVRLYEIDEMQDGLLAKQKLAQLFGWIVKRKGADGPTLTQEENAIMGDEVAAGEATQTEDGTTIRSIKSGGIHYLDEDEEVDFSTPDGIGPNYIEWLKNELRVCAKGIGLTYEQFTGDLSGVNYTSIRAGLIEFRRSIEQVQYNLYCFRFYRTIASWFNDSAVMNGLVNIPGYWDDPAAHLPTFKAQGWDHVDPLKDRMADTLDVRGGFNSRRNIIDTRSGDYDDITKELMEDALGELILDSIPAKTTKTGVAQMMKEATDVLESSEENPDDEIKESDDNEETE